MTTNSETRKDVLNRMVICDQSRGRIKYIGQIHGTNNDSGKIPHFLAKIIHLFYHIFFHRGLVWYRVA